MFLQEQQLVEETQQLSPASYEVKPEGGMQNERDNEPARTVPEK